MTTAESELIEKCPGVLILSRGGRFVVWLDPKNSDQCYSETSRPSACKAALAALAGLASDDDSPEVKSC